MNSADKCLLCLKNEPNKRNSHIVPKFLTKGLFSLAHHRKTLIVHKTGKSRFHQDTPKEDFILCDTCEKRIEVIETEFAPIIRKMHNYRKYPSDFQHVVQGQLEYLKCINVKNVFYNLFFYSIIWRLSVSRLHPYGTLKLPLIVEENIRFFLHENLCATKSELLNRMNREISSPSYYMVLIKPKIKTNPPGGMLSAHSYNENEHLITLVDFILFFFVNEAVIKPPLKPITNNSNNPFLVGMGENTYWIELNSILYHQVLEGGKKTER